MKRTFDQALADFKVGEIIRVSDGFPEPSDPASIDHCTWRSHNFEGELVEIGADWLKFQVEVNESVTLHPTIERGRWPHVLERVISTFDDARADAWEIVKARRDQVEFGVAATPLGPMDTDVISAQRINGAVTMAQLAIAAGEPFSIDWTMADDQVVTHDAPAMIAAGLAVGTHVAQAHAAARALRAQIEAATTTAELEAIDFDAAPWPVVPSVGPPSGPGGEG